MKVTAVESLELPALAPYRSLRQATGHAAAGIFVAEGGTVVRRLLESDLVVDSALLTPVWCERLRPQIEARGDTLAVFETPAELVERIVGFHYHQGAMAVGRIRAERPLRAILEAAPCPRLVVALDGLTSAENVGVVVRNCAAFGVAALIVGPRTADPWLRRAVRNSMGTVFRLPTVTSTDLPAALRGLRARHGFRVFAAAPGGAAAIGATAFGRDACIVFGHEGHGVSPAVMEACDEAVAIPMPPHVDSLNVASATAVFLYEASRRQRGA
ncbi:MAG TPA: RNA methyltransferase [Thermoanaerobaculaceae bacterium]|nr:RNA methyltransferase [Thermoanaerobaculaceae bacterium]